MEAGIFKPIEIEKKKNSTTNKSDQMNTVENQRAEENVWSPEDEENSEDISNKA